MDKVAKVCTQCGEMKPMDDYHRREKAGDGRVSECKSCVSKRQLEIRSRPKSQERRVAYIKENQARMESYYASRGYTCELCLQKHHIASLDLHHLDPSTKTSRTSFPYTRWTLPKVAEVTAEADTCAMLCSNCHRMEHVALRAGGSLMALQYPQVETNLDWRLRYDEVRRNSKETSRDGERFARAIEGFGKGESLDSVRKAAGGPSGGLSAGDGGAKDVGSAPRSDSGPGSGKFVTDTGC